MGDAARDHKIYHHNRQKVVKGKRPLQSLLFFAQFTRPIMTPTKGIIMSKPIVARAILITDANREKISVVNNGVVPNLEEFQTYFVLPYNPNFYNAIFPKKQFLENYEFVEPESFTHFVDIVEK